MSRAPSYDDLGPADQAEVENKAGLLHRGYTGIVEWSEREALFVGRVVGVRDRIAFEARQAADIRAAFAGAVDRYLLLCDEAGRAPNPPITVLYSFGDGQYVATSRARPRVGALGASPEEAARALGGVPEALDPDESAS